ncbi:hypothetical protein EYF80_004348 [Liparis tanakae]|uniref:Uncharacterized protein n=1 Tax=Liparis tanakae TaxID=230148 RepID=A0A4Z2J577_9TELE|nr:hypothetical protein EYF80_004348 [Liparis tanakae]
MATGSSTFGLRIFGPKTVANWVQARKSWYLWKGTTGSGSSLRYSFSREATSKASCSSLTRLACPGSRKRPSSRRPHCRMKSTHCSTSMGASLLPNRRSAVNRNQYQTPRTENKRGRLGLSHSVCRGEPAARPVRSPKRRARAPLEHNAGQWQPVKSIASLSAR